jgi:hypothetical protein
MNWWWRFRIWLDDNWPTVCVVCKRVIRRKNARSEINTMGQVVELCQPCHTELFHPFSKDS